MKKYGIFAFIFAVSFTLPLSCMEDQNGSDADDEASDSEKHSSREDFYTMMAGLTDLREDYQNLAQLAEWQGKFFEDMQRHIVVAQQILDERQQEDRAKILTEKRTRFNVVKAHWTALVEPALTEETQKLWVSIWDILEDFYQPNVLEIIAEERTISIYVQILHRIAETAGVSVLNTNDIYSMFGLFKGSE